MADGGGLPAKRAHRATGRPRGGRSGNSGPLFSQALADRICVRLASGISLREVCDEHGMPSEMTVRTWARENRGADEANGREGFASQYIRARELGFESIAEEVLEFGRGDLTGPDGYVDNGEVQRLRLLSENRKWFLSKLMPRQFGDKVTQEIVGDADQPIVTRIELVPVDPKPQPKTIDHEPDRDDG